MTRSDRIRKLANAVKEYRGRFHTPTGKWLQPPKPDAKERIVHWLTILNLDVESNLKLIDGFKAKTEYEAWIATLE